MTTSGTTETKRDLHADLALIEAVTAHQPGVWFVIHGTEVEREWPAGSCELSSVAYSAGSPSVATFIAEARTAWPIAIERAISAEAEVERLRAHIKRAVYLLVRDAHVPAEIVLDEALNGGGGE